MPSSWLQLLFETCEAGVSSAVAPELLPPNQNAWGMNIDVRGGKPATRPNLRNMGNLPSGLIQGCEFFSVQNGMLVASIAGRIYRLRIGQRSITVEEIPLTFRNSAVIKMVWMTQTVETLVIQDGQSNAILYNGSTAPRSGPTQVPRGRMMAYGNGRLWVSVNANETVAGDIRTGAAGSELYFTEATYLSGGGRLFFPRDITGMAFIPVTGQSDYGVLLIYCAGETNAIRADITSRDDWAKIPGFITGILRSVGSASQWSLVPVNQDLYWRDSNGGIRSIRNALADEAGPGSAPISREVSRLTDYDSLPELAFCSGVYFDNRLLMTSSPFLMQNGGVGFKNLISLDYAPLSTMGAKSQPAYNGQWNGLNFVKLVGGQFNGKNRAFALTTDDAGNNQLWEFGTGARADLPVDCADGTSDGTADPVTFENPITCMVEYPLRDYGQSKTRKRLNRCDVWLSAVNGEVDLKVYWRADNSVKWLLWDEATTCAQTSDPATTTPHVWKNLFPQERPQFKTFTIPDTVNDLTKYSAQAGFEFQIRLVWTGRLRIHRMMVYAQMLDDPDYANRDGFAIECVEDDISGNQVLYELPTDGCPAMIVQYLSRTGGGGDQDPFDVQANGRYCLGSTDSRVYTFRITNPTGSTLYIPGVVITGCPGFAVTDQPDEVIGAHGYTSFQITYTPGDPCVEGAIVSIGNIFRFTIDGNAQTDITTNPEDQTVDTGATAIFQVNATGEGVLTYQWQVSGDGGTNWSNVVDDANYNGAQTAMLTILDTPDEFDENQYRCAVTGCSGIGAISDSATLNVGTIDANVLIVGGGGGGGWRYGGGGGGGGIQDLTDVQLDIGQSYPVVIGAGGAGASFATLPSYQGSSGGLSAVTGLGIAFGGGGGGGGAGLGGTTYGPGAGGGCGGGSGGATPADNVGQSLSPGGGGTQGGNGGKGYFTGALIAGGGGGGAGGNGADATAPNATAGAGGIGYLSSISGSAARYAGGGGGGNNPTGGGGAGGLGGGGAGGAAPGSGVAGSANTGGGGGGTDSGGGGFPEGAGGAGGSGIVIVSYVGAPLWTGGIITSAGGRTIHTFITSGTLAHL